MYLRKIVQLCVQTICQLFSSFNSRIRAMACSNFYEFHHLLYMVYQSLFFFWAYHTEEVSSALILLPSHPHVQANLVCIFITKTIQLVPLNFTSR
jgi:hypothetical protein